MRYIENLNINVQNQEWWQFYSSLGYRLISEDIPYCKIALSVPSRCYVAAFMALGASLASLSRISPTNKHYEYLHTLNNGTALRYQKTGDGRPGKAILEKKENGELWALIHKKSNIKVGGTSQSKILINRSNCKQFTKADVDIWTGDISNRNHRTYGNEFLMKFFNDSSKYKDFFINNFLSTQCIGIKDTIIQEIEEECLEVGPNVGSIGDFLQLNKPIAKAAILSQRINEVHLLDPAPSSIIIYDTATAYLDFRSNKKDKCFHEILVLDRADPYFYEGLICWDQEYRKIDEKYFDGLKLPRGVVLAVAKGD